MKTTTLTTRELWLASASVVCAILLVVTISYRSAVVFRESAEWVRHSHQVLEALFNVRVDIGNIESSYRGYVLTGNDSYLESYRASVPSVTQDEATVRDLTVDNPAQQRRLPALERLTLQAIQLADTDIGLRRMKGFEAAVDAARSGPDTRIVEEVRGVIREMQSEEMRLLGLRNAEAGLRSSQNNAVLILGTALGVFIVATVGWRVQHENFKRGIAEKALQDSEEQYRMLLDGVQEHAIFMLDAEGRIVTWNAGAERIYGYGSEDIVGQDFARFFPSEDIERGRLDKMLRMAEASGRHEERGIRVRKDGSQFMANAIFTALRDAAGNLRGFSEISHDLSESKESAAKYRGLLEAAPDAMVVVNQGGEIVLVNVHAEKQFGYRRDELVGQQVQNIIPEGFAERLLVDGHRSTADALARQIGTGIELSGRRKDGTEFPVEITLSPLESATGILVTAAIRDISVRRAAEQHLGQMEARYRGLLEAAPDAMVVVNRAGEIVLLNVQAEKQFGYPRDELLGQQVQNIIPDGFAERLLADGRRSTADALAQQIGTGIELSGRRKDGTEFPIEIMLSPLDSAEGILVTAAIRDISVRRATEQHMAQMEARYRGLLEAAPDAMVVVNRAGEIVLLNVQAEKQFGYPRDELLGQQVENIIPEGFAERLLADGRRSTAEALAQQIGTGIQLSGRRKDGAEFPIEIMLSPLDSAAGTLVTAAIRDITDRRLIERQLAQAQKMEALGNLTGGMAHDFNNGLGVIIGNLDLLGRLVKADGDALQLCNEAHGGAVRCADLIQRLLAFARQQPLSPRRTNVNALVESIGVLLGRTLGEDITLSLHLGTDLSPVVVDPAQLEAALTNLANNARDAMPRGGRLTIATKMAELDDGYAALPPDVSPGSYVMIEVSDTGTGIAPDVVSRIFEPFFTTKPPGAGSGLGLSMAFGFARQSGGHLSVYSEPGHGSTFRIYLPYAYVGNMQAAAPADERPVLGGDETVLLVEDNAQLRHIAERQLTALGYRVRGAEHAAAALVILSSEAEVDLLFTDVVMPGTLDGLELAQQATRLRPGIKVLLASGFPRVRSGDHRMANNPFPLLSKPYHRDDLARVVREVLDRLDEPASIVTARPVAEVPESMHDRGRVVATAAG